jgi:hypothetical protein
LAEDFGVSCEPLPCRWWSVAALSGEPRLVGGSFAEWPRHHAWVRLAAAELHGVRVANRGEELWFSDNLDPERWGILRARLRWTELSGAEPDTGAAVSSGHGLVWQPR